MRIEEITNKQTWEDFVLNDPFGNFLHSWNWGEFHQNLGKKIFRFGFYQKNLAGVTLLIKEKAKRGDYLICAGGPLIDWRKEVFDSFVKLLKEIGNKEDVVFTRVRPQILDTDETRQLFKSFGFVPAPMHLHAETTWQVDLGKSEEQILKEMRKNTRYEIRKAERLGAKIEQSKSLNDVDFLYERQIETAKRHKFVPFSRDFLRNQFEAFLPDDQVLLFKAFWQGRPVAIAFVLFYGQEAVYHYAATSDEARKCSASYAIQWEAIREAKRRGMNRYNFWGIAPKDDPKHRFWGVTVFKKGFGGFPVTFLHAQDLPLKPTYWATHLFEKARKKFRRL